ncbi:hypothetical protein SNEBB_002432 [Seison nebaliae]|nr:hypothetical protein SNEBB_002432 [Seison nebaliae]
MLCNNTKGNTKSKFDKIYICVGGVHFETLKSTLEQAPIGSRLRLMVSDDPNQATKKLDHIQMALQSLLKENLNKSSTADDTPKEVDDDVDLKSEIMASNRSTISDVSQCVSPATTTTAISIETFSTHNESNGHSRTSKNLFQATTKINQELTKNKMTIHEKLMGQNVQTQREDGAYYDKETGEFFFDRDPLVMQIILDYCRNGELHIPFAHCGVSLKKEFDFWGISDLTTESCCWLHYSQYSEQRKRLEEFDQLFQISPNIDVAHSYCTCHLNQGHCTTHNTSKLFKNNKKFSPIQSNCLEKMKSFGNEVHRIMDYPLHSDTKKIPGHIFLVYSILISLLSIVVTVMETMDRFHVTRKRVSSKGVEYQECQLVFWLSTIDLIIGSTLTLEVTLRFLVSSNKRKFWLSAFNVLDAITLLPFYLILISGAIGYPANDIFTPCIGTPISDNYWNGIPIIITIVNTLTVLRILRIMRHYSGARVMMYTLAASSSEMILIMFVFLVLALFFAVIVYNVECCDKIDSIPIALWWAIVTASTLGYGDIVPESVPGKILGGLCAVVGVIIVAFTVPVAVNNFTLFYSHARSRAQHPHLTKSVWKHRIT